jgi:MFS family permease
MERASSRVQYLEMNSNDVYKRSFIAALIGDGRPLLIFTGLSLVLTGVFFLFLSATHHFLPHDVHFLGMTAEELCRIQNCRVVYFMFHDRVSFGGALIAIGSLYIWLTEFPLRNREAWAWWLLLVTGLVGFASFLAYLGYGYLDTWHGAATLGLIPFFIAGLVTSFKLISSPGNLRSLTKQSVRVPWRSPFGIGRLLLLVTALGMVAGGFTVMLVGMTRVFVPQDLSYVGLAAADLQAINPRIIPLIAHDRAGFGGAICTIGITVFFIVWCAKPSRSLWQALGFAGAVGFASAIGIHPAVGYVDLVHLAPALMGAVSFMAGIVLTYKPMRQANQ